VVVVVLEETMCQAPVVVQAEQTVVAQAVTQDHRDHLVQAPEVVVGQDSHTQDQPVILW
jgi:hypothetical protein